MWSRWKGVTDLDAIKSYLGGGYATGERTYTIYSPVDGAEIAEVITADQGTVNSAVAAATSAHLADATTTAHQRRDRCHRVATELTARRHELAHAVTAETGRPY